MKKINEIVLIKCGEYKSVEIGQIGKVKSTKHYNSSIIMRYWKINEETYSELNKSLCDL